jgi:hypothetical protein
MFDNRCGCRAYNLNACGSNSETLLWQTQIQSSCILGSLSTPRERKRGREREMLRVPINWKMSHILNQDCRSTGQLISKQVLLVASYIYCSLPRNLFRLHFLSPTACFTVVTPNTACLNGVTWQLGPLARGSVQYRYDSLTGAGTHSCYLVLQRILIYQCVWILVWCY